MFYTNDRAFTDFVHRELAVPLVYSSLGWEECNLDPLVAQAIDMNKGIDYIFKDSRGLIRTVQERFRDCYYSNYSDFTIRYRRDDSPYSDRHKSEFYKMKADYFTYGIIDSTKQAVSKLSQFIKVAIIDLHKVYSHIGNGNIIILNNGRNTCSIENGKIICPIKCNKDHSSSFFPIEIKYLIDLWGDEMVVYNKGF